MAFIAGAAAAVGLAAKIKDLNLFGGGESIYGGSFAGGELPTAPHGAPSWPEPYVDRNAHDAVFAWSWAHNPGYWAHIMGEHVFYLTPREMPKEIAAEYFPAPVPIEVANRYLAPEHRWPQAQQETWVEDGAEGVAPPPGISVAGIRVGAGLLALAGLAAVLLLRR